MVPLLTSLHRLPQHVAHGLSLAIVMFVAAASLAGYWISDNLDRGLAVWLALGGMTGAFVGAVTMVKIPERSLRLILGLFLLAVAIRVFIS